LTTIEELEKSMAPALGPKDYSPRAVRASPSSGPMDYSARAPAKRGRLCGKCNFEFHGADASALTWCKDEGIFVCQSCYDRNCAKGVQPHRKGMSTRMAFWGIGFMFAILVTFCYPGIRDLYTVQQFNNLEETAVGNIESGKLVRITGTINASNYYAVGYSEHHSKSGYYTDWDNNAKFHVEDGTGSVLVVCSGYYDIRRSGESAKLTPHISGPVYTNGTRVLVMGDVQDEGGVPVIHLRYLALEGQSPSPDFLLELPLFIIPPMFFVLLAWAGAVSALRNLRHNGATASAAPRELASEFAKKDEQAKWHPNGTLPNPGRRKAYAAFFILLGLIIMVVAASMLSVKKDDLFLVAFIGIFICIFLIFLPIAVAWENTMALTEVGISDRGVHYWYHKPAHRLMNTFFIAWDDVSDVGWFGSGKGRHWAIKQKNGVELGSGALNFKTMKVIEDAWKLRSGKK